MESFVGLVVLGTSIWVLIDAKQIGVRSGLIKGIGGMGPWGWFFACLLLWIVGFPLYLVKRNELRRAALGVTAGAGGMVFCRGCGKQIHSSAPTCPQCGAPQGL